MWVERITIFLIAKQMVLIKTPHWVQTHQNKIRIILTLLTAHRNSVMIYANLSLWQSGTGVLSLPRVGCTRDKQFMALVIQFLNAAEISGKRSEIRADLQLLLSLYERLLNIQDILDNQYLCLKSEQNWFIQIMETNFHNLIKELLFNF